MTMPGVETPVRQTIAVLKAGMSAKLAAIAAEMADGIAPAAPEADAYYFYLPSLFPSYPSVLVRALPESEKPPQVEGEYECAYQVQVDVITRAEDAATSEVHLWRYWRAVKELLCADGALLCGTCNIQGVDWNQPIVTHPDTGEELRDVPGLFVVTTYEMS